MIEAEALHTAARRYCMERTTGWAANILAEIERRTGDQFATVEELIPWLVAAADAAYADATRQADLTISFRDAFLPEMRARISQLGPKAKIVVGDLSRGAARAQETAMREERDAFVTYIGALSAQALAQVSPLPYRRTLADMESERLWSLLKMRWGVDGHWYPIDRDENDAAPRDAVAFQAQAFFDPSTLDVLLAVLRQHGTARVYELREGRHSADHEMDVELLRPFYNFNEGFWLDASRDWLIYASYKGSVTVAGETLVSVLCSVWPSWREHTYTAAQYGAETEVGPGIVSKAFRAEPPPGWERH
jgi:hypothetical protein